MVQSIERGIEILRLLEAGPLGVTELANGTALPKTTVHRLLKTFEAHHWVEFNRDKKYQLSWGVLPMAKSFLTSLDVRAIAQPYMVAIRDQLQQSVNLFLAQGDYRICIERVAADKPLRNDIKIGTDGKITGLDAQVESLKKDKAWLFEEDGAGQSGKQGDKGGNPNGGQGGGYNPQSGGNPNTVNDLGSALAEVYNTNG